MKTFKHLFTALLLLCATVVSAHDFEVDGIYYKITDESNKTVSVTYEGSSYNYQPEYNEYTGDVVLQPTVMYGGNTYNVTGIADNAFEYCANLQSVTIPSSIKSIGYRSFENCLSLQTVNLSEGLTSIGVCAFQYCTKLTAIVIPSSVTTISNYAFRDCPKLESVTFCAQVAPTVATDVFTRISSTAVLKKPAGSDYSSWSGYFARTEEYVASISGSCGANVNWTLKDGVLTISGSGNMNDYSYNTTPWYKYKSDIKSVIIKSGVTSISAYSFLSYNIKSVEIPNSVTTIGEYAFSGCYFLTSIEIPGSVLSFGRGVFSGCASLKKVELGNGVTTIGYDMFNGCEVLTSIVIPNGVTGIGNSAFSNCYSLASVEIPNTVTSIGESAFYNCKKITSIKIPNSVVWIHIGAFRGCISLASVDMGDGVIYIGSSAFNGCTALTNVKIGSNVTTISANAFYNCSKLASITIPSKVTIIETNAFYGCTALKTVTNDSNLNIEKGSISNGYVAYYADEVIMSEFKFELIDGVYTLVKYRGNGTKQEEVTTFDSWTSTNQGQSGSTSSHKYKFDAIVGSKLSFDWSVSSEANYDKFYVILDGTTVLTKSGIESGNYEYTFTVAGSHTLEVRYAKDGSADRNDDKAKIDNVKLTRTIYKLVDVVLPDNYEGKPYVIGESAFENNEFVASVTIPEGVEMICDKAFSGCINLENIVIPNSVSAIGSDAFVGTKWYDNQEDGMVYAGNVLYKYKGSMPANTAITISDGTLGIAGKAFADCSGITSVTIPSSMTTIGDRAFYNCSNIKDIISYVSAEDLFIPGSEAFAGVSLNTCTLYVPYNAKETYATTEGWKDFVNIEGYKVTITINQYGSATYCSEYALDFSEVEGLKAYAATGYNTATQVITLTRVQTAKEGTGLFIMGEPGEYTVPVIEHSNDYTLNLLVGTLERTTVNATTSDGNYMNFKYTVKSGDNTPMFYQFEDNSTLSAGKAYLQLPAVLFPSTASKSVSVRFDDGKTTDIEELEGDNGTVKTVYDLQGRVVENPTNGIYIIDGKKVVIKK